MFACMYLEGGRGAGGGGGVDEGFGGILIKSHLSYDFNND